MDRGVEVIWGALDRKDMGEGSTGGCWALLDGRDGFLGGLLSGSGSDSVPLKDLSRRAEAKGRRGDKITARDCIL